MLLGMPENKLEISFHNRENKFIEKIK
jgi:hypothetical protein